MSVLHTRDVLSDQVVRVGAESRPADVLAEVEARRATHVAVFDDRRFCGLVKLQDALSSTPHRIFADLLPGTPQPSLSAQTPIEEIDRVMRETGWDALPVVSSDGAFVGAVTSRSLVAGLLENARRMLEERQKWGSRLGELDDANRRLLSLISRRVDRDRLLQEGIEVLASLTDARYGAVGVFDDAGKLATFAHTGLTPEEVQRIDRPPRGAGLLGVMSREPQTLRMDDLTQHPSSVGFPPGHPQMRSFLGVPIAGQDEVLGRVYLTEKRDGGRFTQADEEVARLFAGALSLAIEEARLSEQLKYSEERLRNLVENAVDGIITMNTQGVIESFNPAAERIFGCCAGEVIGKRLTILMRDALAERHTAGLRRYLETGEGKVLGRIVEVPGRRNDGREITLALSVSESRHDGRRFFTGIVRDISERKRAREAKEKLEAQLRRSQRMESIGTLAGGIAHDFNNMLTPIIGYTDMALEAVPSGSQVQSDLERVIRVARRAKSLVQQILTFGRQVEQQRKLMPIHSVLEEALKLLRPILPATIQMRRNIDCGCGMILADPTQVYQVVVNLCTNAYQAMSERGGVLGLSLDTVEVDAEFAGAHPNLREGPYVRLTVSDTGPGMDQVTVERVFEPFFTTKGVGEGSGLGLSVVHGIVRNHGGAITVDSEPGRGTVFHVYFPRADREVEGRSLAGNEPVGKGIDGHSA